jgi:hypothetical protein
LLLGPDSKRPRWLGLWTIRAILLLCLAAAMVGGPVGSPVGGAQLLPIRKCIVGEMKGEGFRGSFSSVVPGRTHEYSRDHLSRLAGLGRVRLGVVRQATTGGCCAKGITDCCCPAIRSSSDGHGPRLKRVSVASSRDCRSWFGRRVRGMVQYVRGTIHYGYMQPEYISVGESYAAAPAKYCFRVLRTSEYLYCTVPRPTVQRRVDDTAARIGSYLTLLLGHQLCTTL